METTDSTLLLPNGIPLSNELLFLIFILNETWIRSLQTEPSRLFFPPNIQLVMLCYFWIAFWYPTSHGSNGFECPVRLVSTKQGNYCDILVWNEIQSNVSVWLSQKITRQASICPFKILQVFAVGFVGFQHADELGKSIFCAGNCSRTFILFP